MAALSTLAIAAISISVAGAITSSITAGVQGVEQYMMSKYNADLADQQAEIQAQNASRARIQAENEAIAKENDTAYAAKLERNKMERVKSLNRAREGAGGMTMSGTPLMLQLEAAENIELNHLEMIRQGADAAAAIRYQGEMNAYGHEVAALNARGRSTSFNNQATNAAVGGGMQAGTTLLSGLGNAAMSGIKLKSSFNKTAK